MLPYRCYLIPGALVALIIIKAAAMVRMALAADEPTLITKDWNVSVSTYYSSLSEVCSSCCSNKQSSTPCLNSVADCQ